jgi:uncharacterized membrane protein
MEMSIPCPDCAAMMPDTAAFCPGCGRVMRAPEPAHGTVDALPEKVAGALAYLTIVPAVVFLLLDPYKKNRFVRFHSIQCLMFWLASVGIGAALKLVGILLLIIPFLGQLLALLIFWLIGFAAFVIWAVLVVKALQGERFKLPVLGDLAEKQAQAV